ncbi:palindromic element RPE4 domain-containing protein [Rickettsia endosymbiont of Ceutorhynchus obstrictus]|uniref:palindromic element RPE4 domain-containing protein n=1 Tax=Rickettsia endosymbiont of Ceutorhynchus obstrictus TaxID=3066249 RepID=UPI00397CDE8E
MTQPFFNVRTVVGLTTVSRKTLIKRLDAVVKPRHDTETLCKNSSHATTLENGNLEKILLSHPEFISGYLGN